MDMSWTCLVPPNVYSNFPEDRMGHCQLSPLQIAEYSVAMHVDHEPGFNWWVLHTLKKCDAIISLVKKHSAKYLKHMHKFGIECPKTVDDALELDKSNGNTMWADTITKEMTYVQVAFIPLDNDVQPPNQYKFIQCHMIFNVKMENSHQKAQLVTKGHMIDVPPTEMYVTIELQETDWIKLTMVALK